MFQFQFPNIVKFYQLTFGDEKRRLPNGDLIHQWELILDWTALDLCAPPIDRYGLPILVLAGGDQIAHTFFLELLLRANNLSTTPKRRVIDTEADRPQIKKMIKQRQRESGGTTFIATSSKRSYELPRNHGDGLFIVDTRRGIYNDFGFTDACFQELPAFLAYLQHRVRIEDSRQSKNFLLVLDMKDLF